MRTPIRTRPLWVITAALAIGTAARGQDLLNAKPPDSEPQAEAGFPWLCFLTAVAALGGLYVLVRRREREVGLDRPGVRKPEPGWYCRACDRDVTGPTCPRCHAPNPFLIEPASHGITRRGGVNTP
ncbi:MAG TPA: hypothetical protein VKD90_16840 [Gemmataceae bacterium]|nr:hypothetical protein [Gemmataceae bacterium]